MIKDASYWAEQIKEGNISPLELLDLTKKKYDADQYNAIVTYDYEAAQEKLKNWKYQGRLFDGLPIATKALGQDIKGHLATAASRLLRNHRANTTDNFVSSLEGVGFIPFGQTNSPEFGFKNITDSKLYGDCLNVWNKNYYSGGSSGGAATAVASGLVPLASASDGGGSIRIPASWSSLIGLKPSRGRIITGPAGYRGWQGASVNLAETISVRDTARFLLATQASQEANPFSRAHLFSAESLLNLKNPGKLRIAFTSQSPVDTPVTDDAKKALNKTVKFLEEMGHEVYEVDYPLDARPLIEDYYMMNAAETFTMFTNMGADAQTVYDECELMTYVLYEYGRNVSIPDYSNSFNSWDQATNIFMEKIFSNFDLFLTPTTASTASKIGEELISDDIYERMENISQASLVEQKEVTSLMFEKSLEKTPYPFVVNLTGQAAISLPVYLSEFGLPLGVQFMGPKDSELLLLLLAKQFEDQGRLILPDYYK